MDRMNERQAIAQVIQDWALARMLAERRAWLDAAGNA